MYNDVGRRPADVGTDVPVQSILKLIIYTYIIYINIFVADHLDRSSGGFRFCCVEACREIEGVGENLKAALNIQI